MTEKTLSKPAWHGILREEIAWHPTLDHELCTRCGICVIGCGKEVYKFDYENNLVIVANPLNCLVGCTTCENTCPQHAISFPSMSYLHKLIKKRGVIHHSKKVLNSKKETYKYKE